jgi:hypothetical protein
LLAALGAPRAYSAAPVAHPAPLLPGTAVRVPKRYLRSVIDEAFLAQHLLPAGEWRPYPRAVERDGWRQVPADVVDAVTTRADQWLDAEWPQLPASLFLEFKQNGNRTRYEQRYFERRNRLAGLVMAECLQGQGRYLRAIADGVWHICEEGFWGLPAHSGMQRSGVGLPDVADPVIDLFAAETGVTLAYVHYLLGAELGALSPLLPARIQAEVRRRILDPGWLRDDFKWMGLKDRSEPLNNWTSWIASSWLEANLLLEADPARRMGATLKICGCLDRYLEDYSDDGACEEGPGYWALSAGAYVDCLAALDSATGGTLGLAADPFVRSMGHYVLDMHVAGDWYVNYGDAHAKVRHSPPLLYRAGRATGDREMMAFAAFRASARGMELSGQGRLARDIPDVLQVAPMRSHARADALVRASWYPALGLMTARARAGSSAGFYLAVQTASNARSHGHHDSGSFIVFHDGAPVFIDPGVEAYTAKTFSAERYSIWTMQSGYHNLPIVAGRMQQGGQAGYRASRVKVDDSEAATSMTMDLATAYGPDAGIGNWERTVALQRVAGAGAVSVREAFRLARPALVTLVFMTPRLPEPAGAGRLALGSPQGGGKAVHMRYDALSMGADIERIALTDAGLRREWGEAIYRIRLTTLQPVRQGSLSILVE